MSKENTKQVTLDELLTAKEQCAEIIRRASNDNQRKLLLIYKRLEKEISSMKSEDDLLNKILSQ
jgi:hypothetical protein